MRAQTIESARLQPGVNLDPIDHAAGMAELAACGYTDARTAMVIDYALARWARGEEAQAQRGAIDRSFHGIDLTSWYRVIAAAQASGARAHALTKAAQDICGPGGLGPLSDGPLTGWAR